jgi:protocatechuate 3,4-dioxygenase alpha subunit
MLTSPYCTIGPYFPYDFVDGLEDLTHFNAVAAQGPRISIRGRVLEEGNRPTKNTILEIWQPDAGGIFRHPLDPRCSQADPGFRGWGRARTDALGNYRFLTVLPGSYSEASSEASQPRCPHINVMILAIGLTRRLVTTIFFAGAPENVSDPVLDCVPESMRPRLFATRQPLPGEIAEYAFDIVLRGENETPFFLD